MGKRKTVKAKLAEGRCQGIGPDYVPFYKANEGGSRATTYMIPNPIEGRMIHCLSDTEAMMYYLLRWNPEVEHIREQYLLDTEKVNDVRWELGYSRVAPQICFTTDFLVDYRDGSQQAFSVKFSAADFDRSSRQYQGRDDAYIRLIEHQNTERLYWERQGVEFNIVTRDDMLPFRIQIKNIAFLLRFWDEKFIVNQEQKLLYLIAHHIVEIPLSDQFINPKQLVQSVEFDIDSVYQKAIDTRRELLNG